tara:strand:- start:130 stop:1146 length:1017 start_codon:yes stop_codon:yes gene_type:complete
MKKSDNSIRRDIVFAIIGIAIFYAVLGVANWLDGAFGLIEAFTFVDIASTVTKTLVASALAFALLKIGFRHTLGKDIGKTFDEGWDETPSPNKARLIIIAVLVFFASIMLSGASASLRDLSVERSGVIPGLSLPVSDEARDLIVGYEVGGKIYYQKYLSGPTWPGGASGVTIGFGYDLGYNNATQIRKDWGGLLSSSEVNALISVSGRKGGAGKYALASVKNRVRVSWDEAQEVFDGSTLPRFAKTTQTAFGLSEDRLHPHSNGALVSIVFNRGASMKGSRRREMANIRDHIAAGYAGRVPREIRSMKRLWQGRGLDGLIKRRDAEAGLFERGLKMRN